MVELVVRLVFSLAVVLGMLMLLARFGARKFRGNADALVRVVHRQPLSRTTAVAVVTVGSRTLVLGTTEHQVQLITELDPEEFELAVTPAEVVADAPLELVKGSSYAPRHAADAAEVAPVRATTSLRPAEGALAGSVLSAQTWKQAFNVATSKVRDAS